MQGDRHDWLVGLDSDAFIANHSIPVHLVASEFLHGRPHWGADPADSHLIAFNEPICHTREMLDVGKTNSCCLRRYANTGFVLGRVGATAESLLRRWWDVDDIPQALLHPFEQDDFGTLWRDGLRNATSVVCVSSGGFFRPDAPNQWMRHFPGGYVMRERHQWIRAAAETVGVNASTFPGIISEMISTGAVRPLDQAALSAMIAARTAAEPGGGTHVEGCVGNLQCSDEPHGDPAFGVTPGLSRRTPPFDVRETVVQPE
jgi:hypothetical protein